MDPSLHETLTLEGMDFDHSVDVVNQEDITLEDTGRLDTISMDMDDIGQQSHNLMEATNDEVIVSDLIEEPFPFQEYTTQCDTGDSSNIMIDPNKISELDTQLITAASTPKLQALLKAPAAPMSNVVTLKAQSKVAKRIVATAPPRQVAIAPKPVPKTIQYAIAPKPVTLVANKQAVSTMKKIPITTDGKGNTVLAQIGRQLVMVPKKIKLMSSSSSASEGLLNTSSTSGLQYQMTMTPEQMQMMNSNKGKPMLKFIQLPADQSGGEASSSGTITKILPGNVPKARYVMQQKTVPITPLGSNKMVQNFKIAGKKQIIAIKPQSPQVVNAASSQGNVTTKKVVISSNSGQKVMTRSTAPTMTTQTVNDSGQRTQIHPINVPGKGIQYIKLVTNQATQKVVPKATPAKNFVFTDSKGKVIQMTAEKVSQPSSVLLPGTSNKGVVKTIKCKKKLVRIAPISNALTQSTSQPARSSQSLLAPITSTPAAMSLPVIETPSKDISLDFIEIGDDKISNYINKSAYDSNDFTIPNDNDYSVEGFSTANEFEANLHEETVQDQGLQETIDVKPTLQSLISEAVGDDTGGEDMQEVEIEFEKKSDMRNPSFMVHEQNQQSHDTSNASAANEKSIIIVPGNYTDNHNESLYSDDSQSYRRYSEDNKRNVPLLAVSVEAECIPYPEMAEPPLSPHMSDQEAAAALEMRPRKACNCTKSQCLKLYCDCFANGEFCNSCNCNNCHNNLENEETRQKAIRSCLERNPNAFRPKIGKAKAGGPEIIRRHTKGCNCKRSGCLKNYCECYEAKIACTAMCKCVGCRNVEETLMRRRDVVRMREKLNEASFKPAPPPQQPVKQACSFMTYEVIEAVCQCLLAAAADGDEARADPVHDVIEEFARCLQDVITASHHAL